MHAAKQGGLQAIWGIGFKMILVDRMESEINWVQPSNDEYDVDVFCPGSTGRERVDRQQRG